MREAREVNSAELSVEGWLASTAAVADELDVDAADLQLGRTDPLAEPTCRRVARCRPDQETRS